VGGCSQNLRHAVRRLGCAPNVNDRMDAVSVGITHHGQHLRQQDKIEGLGLIRGAQVNF